MSDVFGEFIDLINGAGTDTAGVRWMMGEDIPGFGAIRDMENPPAFGDPDRMQSPNYISDPARGTTAASTPTAASTTRPRS